MPAIPILLDTDIGDDIDDALALALALASPEVELLDITTVFIDAPRRAAFATYLLDILNQSSTQSSTVHVTAGCSRPVLQPLEAALGSQFEIAPNWHWNDSSHAVDRILQTAFDSEHPVTLVPIGPLTSIAVALAREPRLAERCQIVLMGGHLSAEIAEWNIHCDPEAAAMVFKSGAKISMVGLDVTKQCTLNQSQIEALVSGSSTRSAAVYTQLIQLWQRTNSHDLTLHDPLALMSVFAPDVIEWQERRIEIGLCGDERGKTLSRQGEPNARVAVGVDSERVVELFTERVGALLRRA